MSAASLRVEKLSKHFGAFAALTDVSLEIEPGEVRGLVGSNGSGKSTLVKILSGYHEPDRGSRAWLWGREVPFPIRNAPRLGVATIHQDLGLWDQATVLENFGLGSSYGSGWVGPIRMAQERERLDRICAAFGVLLPHQSRVADLTPAQCSILALARTLRQAREHAGRSLLLLDEPTVAFTRTDVDHLFRVVSEIARQGDSVIFIGHSLREVLQISDRVSVLRDGRLVGTLAGRDAAPEDVLRLMLGREVGRLFPERSRRSAGEIVLEVDGLSGPGVEAVGFVLRAGEIVGVTGLAGMGQDELPYLIIGSQPASHGQITIRGQRMGRVDPTRAAGLGLALVPANRARLGLWREADAVENTTLPVLGRYFQRGLLRRGPQTSEVAALFDQLGVRPADPGRRMGAFSGGNQQKLVIARALISRPFALLLHEPTMGVDAIARYQIMATLQRLAGEGVGILIFSREYEELAAMCDRILVMESGRIVRELSGELDEESILRACHAA